MRYVSSIVATNIPTPFHESNANARVLVGKVLKGEEIEIHVIFQEDLVDGGFFVTTDPTLPIFTDGETIQEVKANFKEAFELFFEEEIDNNPGFDLEKIKLVYFQKILLTE